MKKIGILLALTITSLFTQAIEVTTEMNRIITVTGSAEMVVPPDEIELEITITEQGNQLSGVEKAFWTILLGHQITENDALFNHVNSTFYWYYWWHHRNDSRQSKQITLKLDAKTDFMKLVKDLDKDYITSIRITGSSNKHIQELREEVKIEAIRAAKKKAAYLLEAVDAELGELVQVDEIKSIDNSNPSWYWQPQQDTYSNSVLSYSKSGRSGSYMENVPEIKLRYEIQTKFKIK
ncbi:MAG: SIMPL domain-containing protein [Flavobacteriales bacterium]|nr:SIMPL domain-containing protein [Flavobacteriales bacterium]